ncbi:MAG: hypothetical protein ACT4OM_07430 [Actinomycetota bacterium]
MRASVIVDQMRTLPAQVRTLPPDGLVLEELISTMQTEYGTPSTPQEYRLIVKVPPPEDIASPTAPAEPAAEVKKADPEESARRTNSRRRRRGRRRSPGETSGPVDSEVEGGPAP